MAPNVGHVSVDVLVPETPDGAIRLPKPLFGVVPETPVMTLLFASLDSAYVSRHVDPDDTELKLPAMTENAEWTTAPKRKEHRSVWTYGSSPEARRHSQKERETKPGIDDDKQKAEGVTRHRKSQSAESNRSMQKERRKCSGETGEADKSRQSLTEVRYRDNRRHEKVDGRSRRPPATYSVKEDTEPKKVGDESESSDTEKSETEEAVLNLRPVNAALAENTGTEEASSVRESLAEKLHSDLEFGLLVKLSSVRTATVNRSVDNRRTENRGHRKCRPNKRGQRIV